MICLDGRNLQLFTKTSVNMHEFSWKDSKILRSRNHKGELSIYFYELTYFGWTRKRFSHKFIQNNARHLFFWKSKILIKAFISCVKRVYLKSEKSVKRVFIFHHVRVSEVLTRGCRLKCSSASKTTDSHLFRGHWRLGVK